MKNHSTGFLAVVEDAKTRIKEVDVPQTMAALKADPKAVLVDVREESEFAAGHVVGSVHLSKGVIERDVERQYPDHNTPLYLYCGGGFRSALAADNLQKMGYTTVYSVAGGWRALVDSGAPITK